MVLGVKEVDRVGPLRVAATQLEAAVHHRDRRGVPDRRVLGHLAPAEHQGVGRWLAVGPEQGPSDGEAAPQLHCHLLGFGIRLEVKGH